MRQDDWYGKGYMHMPFLANLTIQDDRPTFEVDFTNHKRDSPVPDQGSSVSMYHGTGNCEIS